MGDLTVTIFPNNIRWLMSSLQFDLLIFVVELFLLDGLEESFLSVESNIECVRHHDLTEIIVFLSCQFVLYLLCCFEIYVFEGIFPFFK